MIRDMLLAGAGGFVGTCLRYLSLRLCSHVAAGSFPLGTFSVNALGCLAIGLIMGLAQRTGLLGQSAMLLLVTGFCGGFTTYSAFSADLLGLADRAQWLTAAAYFLLTVGSGLFLVWLGRRLTL